MTRTLLGTLGALVFAGAALAGGDHHKGKAHHKPTEITRNESLDRKLEKQVQPTIKEFEAAWNAHDPKALAAVFKEDAVVINPAGKLARGRSEIEKLFGDEHQRWFKESTFRGQITDVRQVSPGVALVDQEITITGAKDRDGNAIPEMKVHAAMVLTRQGEKWTVADARAFRFQSGPPMAQGVGGAGEAGEELQAPSEPPVEMRPHDSKPYKDQY